MLTQPIIKVEISRMHHAIMTMLDAKHEDLSAMLEKAIENSIVNLQDQMNREASRLMNEQMNKALTSAISKLFYFDGPLVKQIDELVQHAAKNTDAHKHDRMY